MFKNFYKKNQKEIVFLVKSFLDNDLYRAFPGLSGKISVIITGSVACNHYDKYSDIDLDLIFLDKKTLTKFKNALNLYKKNELAKLLNVPIQIHSFETYDEVERKISNWENDVLIREFGSALIVDDKAGKFHTIKKKCKWYPQEVYKEKIRWLFAELTFVLTERYRVAVIRRDAYYASSCKIKAVRLISNTLLLANKQFSANDKHLFFKLKELNLPSNNLLINEFNRLLKSNNPEDNFQKLILIKNSLERELLKKKLISKEKDEYWVKLRTKYKVDLG